MGLGLTQLRMAHHGVCRAITKLATMPDGSKKLTGAVGPGAKLGSKGQGKGPITLDVDISAGATQVSESDVRDFEGVTAKSTSWFQPDSRQEVSVTVGVHGDGSSAFVVTEIGSF